MKAEGDPVQMNWIIQFYPKNGLDGAHMGTSQTKNSKCIGSNMVNHAQDWSWVKKFIDLPNKHIPSVDILFSSRDKSWTLYYGEQGPACSLVFCPPHPISPTQHITAPWDFRGKNNFILGIILQCATNDSAHGSWWKSSRFLDVPTGSSADLVK